MNKIHLPSPKDTRQWLNTGAEWKETKTDVSKVRDIKTVSYQNLNDLCVYKYVSWTLIYCYAAFISKQSTAIKLATGGVNLLLIIKTGELEK